jgi:hypothetical protein
MPRNLRTDWLTIGRSGQTVDNREISPQDIKDMAETYNPDVYTALIWPEHFRYYNMGRVLELRATGNSEGGQDLQAILAPNEYYLNANSYDQKLFTSMEIQPDFRKSGKAYLIGLGATDSPASTGTSEVRFSRQDKESLVSKPVEIVLTTKPEKPSLFERLFGSTTQEDEDMSKEAIQALAEELKALRKEVAELKSTTEQKPNEPPASTEADKFAALEKKIDELAAKFSTQPQASTEPNKESPEADKLKAIEEKFAELEKKFTEALNTPHPGTTNAPKQTGTEGDRKDYL